MKHFTGPAPHRRHFGLAAAAAMIAASWSAPAMADDMGSMKGMAKPGSAAQSPADRAFAASMKTMMKNMAAKPTNNPDKDFVNMMLPHHQGAVDMAKVELQYGKDPLLLKLAADIVKAQEIEITEMQDWRAKHP